MVDFTEDFAYLLSETLEKTHTKLVVSLHDYHFLCPSINMVDLDGHVCKSVHRTKCEHCCRLKGVFPFWKNLKISKDILSKAIKVIAPSEITCKIYSSVFSSIPLTVIPHDESYLNIVNEIGYSCEDDRTFRIGFLGAVNDLKGVRIIKELAERSGREKSDIELVVIGYTNIDDELANLGVKILGQYGSDEEAIKTICKNRIDIIFLPFQWNETYSYVTSLALASGVPVAVTRLGAAAERLEALGLGDHIIDSETLNDSDLLVAKLKKISKLPKIRYQPNHTDIEQYYDDI